MYVGMYVCFLFYPMGYNSIYLFKLDAQTGPDLATGSIFKMVSVFFWQAYHFFFFEHFFAFSNNKIFQTYFSLSLF